jgi:hypothetical protein
MYVLQIKDDDFNRLTFKFNSMKELTTFADTALLTSAKSIEIIITREEDEDVETIQQNA